MINIDAITLTIEEFETLCQKHFTHDYKTTIATFMQHEYAGGYHLREVSNFDPNSETVGTDEDWINDTKDCSCDGVPTLICLLQTYGALPKDKTILLYV